MTLGTCTKLNCKKSTLPNRKICPMHTARISRTGNERLIQFTIKERFLMQIHLTNKNKCWEWRGYKQKGYGRFLLNGKKILAHRASFIIFFGKIKNGMYICHKCDNPSCVNPNHLYAGTPKQNALDSLYRNRNYMKKGDLNPRAKLNSKVVKKIKYFLSLNERPIKLSKMFNISYSSIQNIKRGITWKHI